MPLKYAAEFQKELNAVISKTKDESTSAWVFLVLSAVVVSAIAAILALSGADGATVISRTIIACTAWISWQLAWEAKVLHLTLVILTSVVEWVGRKQLGEYKPPQAVAGDRG